MSGRRRSAEYVEGPQPRDRHPDRPLWRLASRCAKVGTADQRRIAAVLEGIRRLETGRTAKGRFYERT